MGTVPIAEHGHGEEDVATEDECMEFRLHGVPHATLAAVYAGSKVRTSGGHGIWFNHAGTGLAYVFGAAGKFTGLDAESLTHHDDGNVDNADDGEEGSVPEGSDLLLEGNWQNDKQSYHNEDEFTAEEEVEVGRHFRLQHLRQTEV